MPGSCKRGLRSLPSNAAGSIRSSGLDVSKVNKSTPIFKRPSTPSMRAIILIGRCFEKMATASVQPAIMKHHNKIEPSWLPHEAPIRYIKGSAELEFCATLSTLKSLLINEITRQTYAKVTHKKSPIADGLAKLIRAGRLVCAPMSGAIPSTSAVINARIKATWPISGIMVFSL